MVTVHFLASEEPRATAALTQLTKRYGNASLETADIIAPIGGDGFMLETLKTFMNKNRPIYGINRGTVGFLMNDLELDDLPERIKQAESATIHPLVMAAKTRANEIITAIAINEVSLLRETRQTARIDITVNGKQRLETLICDGAMVATPAGSTAYNLSAHGPILPISSKLLALTPISAFRPRRWRGALLPHDAVIEFSISEPDFRPVSAVADNVEARDVTHVRVAECRDKRIDMLFDRGQSLEERIIREQFAY